MDGLPPVEVQSRKPLNEKAAADVLDDYLKSNGGKNVSG